MRNMNHLYQGMEEMRSMLEKLHFLKTTTSLVKIFTCDMSKEMAVHTAKQIKDLLPNAHIVGASAAGIIFEGKQYEDKTMIIVEQYDSLTISTKTFSWKNKVAAQLATEVCTAFETKNQEFIHILFSDRYYDVYAFVEAVNSHFPAVRMAGGIAGDVLMRDEPGFVFTEKGIVPEGAIAFSVTGSNATFFLDVNTAQEPISPVFTVTETNGSFIKTIENEPADTWLYRFFDLDELHTFHNWKSIADHDDIIRFQMILEGHGTAGRFLRYDEQHKCLSLYFSQIPQGTKFRIGYTNSSKCVRDCYELCQKIMEQPIERLFVYTCLFRKLYMRNSSEWELRPLQSYKVCGIFMMGEIGFIHGKNEFYNGSCIVSGIAENKQYIMPDLSKFIDMGQIKDNFDKITFALKKKRETLSTERSDLIKGIETQRREVRRSLYVDARCGLPNVLMYQEEDKKYHFDKMCMIQVENEDILISYAGLDAYLRNTKEIIEHVQKHLFEQGYHKDIFFYCVTQSIFFFTASKNINSMRFEKMMRKIYKDFQYYKSVETGLAQMARFVLVFEQDDMLQGGLNALQATKDVQSHFIICKDKDEVSASSAEELEIIELLNTAIRMDGIYPYYQGIRNNHTGYIDRYEALMRLIDTKGKVYAPAVFLDIAKKYHLYSNLSRMMISKVLDEFEKRNEMIAINISAYDVESTEFRECFLECLHVFPDPRRITIEIVESEDYTNSATIFDFVEQLRIIGCKIAIDDFGSGYSSLLEVISLRPDYIKVDGSIITELNHHPQNQILLKTIVFLAKQLGIQTVAEFVEDANIQQLVVESGVDFSQGYLYSKPMPFGI